MLGRYAHPPMHTGQHGIHAPVVLLTQAEKRAQQAEQDFIERMRYQALLMSVQKFPWILIQK